MQISKKLPKFLNFIKISKGKFSKFRTIFASNIQLKAVDLFNYV